MSKRVLFGQFMHETNTFSVQPADVAAFDKMFCYRGDDVPARLRGTNSETAGAIDAAEAYGWQPAFTVAAFANPCGLVTDEAWHALGGRIVRAARERGPFAGACIHLHGAMVTESYDDAEGQLLAELREVLGPEVPIAVTFDLHANVGPRTAELADIVVSYQTYPHVDMRARGRQAADLLERAMNGEIRPRTVLARRPMLHGPDMGRTDIGPNVELQARARAFEREPGVLAVSVNSGFQHADIADVGPTVTVTGDGDGDDPRYRAIAEELAEAQWQARDVTSNRFYTPDEAAALAKRHDGGGKPLIVADFADNPGAGAYGDATNLLRAMLDARLENAAFGTVRDAEAAAALCAAGVGASVTLPVGGKVDPAFGGPPLELSGEVVHVGDGAFVCEGPMWAGVEKHLGPTAVLRVGGVEVVVASNLMQVLDVQTFVSQGIDPRARATVALKSMQHFRAAFEPLASAVIVCDSGALASPDFSKLTFNKVRRPLYPFDR